jgi:hypothetical protein
MKTALNARQAAEALQAGGAVASNKPGPSDFRYHIVNAEDSKTKNLKSFRIASITSTPWLFGADKQDYTPEMLAWDQFCVDNNQPPEMAQSCDFNVDRFLDQVAESCLVSEFLAGSLKAFKYHIHFVPDQKVGQKKFFVASITALPRYFGADDQHYTPEMLAWDEIQLNSNAISKNDTMAAACGTSVDEIFGLAHEAEERTEEALFKANLHEIQDAKVGVKKFYVAAMTSTAAHYGQDSQHYTPEMYHWDCLRRDNPGLRDDTSSMADMCGEKMEGFK